jgi:hypothetical protein
VAAYATVVGGAAPVGVGAALGIPWAARAGLGWVSTLGLVLLGSGLLLWGAGLWLAWRRQRRLQRWVGVPGVLVAALVVAYAVAVPVAVVTQPPGRLGGVTPADRGLTYRSVQMTSPEGVTLAGWFVPGTNGAAVVLRHGSGSTRTAVVDHAAVLARHGYGVLLTDARGNGVSQGRTMAWGWHGDDDITAALDLLAATPGVDPDRLSVVGLSMGGEEGVGATDPRVRAVVAEGVTGRSAEDLRWLPDEYGWRGWVTLQLHRAQTSLVQLLSGAAPPPPLRDTVAATAPRPTLLVAAGTVADEQHAARDLAAHANGGVEVWVVPRSAHTGGLRTAPRDWEARVVGFLDRALAPR